ncbi:hypothetical protein F4819DRAFT_31838 [Hypoxylon fuscum]|nr:hypothetical protein F4819DRAFT_31838 [Hypoxylon fuscum]
MTYYIPTLAKRQSFLVLPFFLATALAYAICSFSLLDSPLRTFSTPLEGKTSPSPPIADAVTSVTALALTASKHHPPSHHPTVSHLTVEDPPRLVPFELQYLGLFPDETGEPLTIPRRKELCCLGLMRFATSPQTRWPR